MKKAWIWILIIGAIVCSIVIYRKCTKAELVRKVDEERIATSKAYAEILPVYTANGYSWIKDVSCSTKLQEKPKAWLNYMSCEN